MSGTSGGRHAVHRYRTSVEWAGTTAVGYEHYDRAHRAVTRPTTVELDLSGDVAFRGDPARLNPEQLVVLAASSCQLLSFLAVAARARLDVVAYSDEAEGEMPEDDPPLRLTTIRLRPRVVVRMPPRPEDPARADVDARVRHLLEVAHRECFIAQSLRSEITIDPEIEVRVAPRGGHDAHSDVSAS